MPAIARTRLLSLALVSALGLSARLSLACERNEWDGSPVVRIAWYLDPNQVQSYIGDGSRLVLGGGTRLPDGRNAFGHDIFGREFIEFWPKTSGVVWDDGSGGRQPSTGWWFVYWDSSGPTMFQTLSVERDCFVDFAGTGATSMIVSPMFSGPHAVANAPGDEFSCSYADRSADAVDGVAGMPGAALTMPGVGLPGWGFGEWVTIEQSPAYGQRSRVVAHDEQCDARAVGIRPAAFAMQYGTVPPLFIGPNSATRNDFGNAGSYITWQIGPGQHYAVMAKQTDAICYLAGLGGKFIHDSETAQIGTYIHSDGTNSTYYWALFTTAGEGGSVWAKANCYAYDQRF